jgi:hypothetical protein
VVPSLEMGEMGEIGEMGEMGEIGEMEDRDDVGGWHVLQACSDSVGVSIAR